MLGRLATWLRILGYDAAYFHGEDVVLLEQARREGRILLTRDRGLLRRRELPPHLFVRSDHVVEQMRQVMEAFQLSPMDSSGRRCPRCNVLVERRSKAELLGRVPEFVLSQQETFWSCPSCRRVYWAGSHWRHMDQAIRALTGC
jgi:uncharacterized protein with PIN domain